jgi:hypothetical protein
LDKNELAYLRKALSESHGGKARVIDAQPPRRRVQCCLILSG